MDSVKVRDNRFLIGIIYYCSLLKRKWINVCSPILAPIKVGSSSSCSYSMELSAWICLGVLSKLTSWSAVIISLWKCLMPLNLFVKPLCFVRLLWRNYNPSKIQLPPRSVPAPVRRNVATENIKQNKQTQLSHPSH